MVTLDSVFGENEILLTGANGFLGKVVLALLLDRFPLARRVHVLVRSRPGISGEERFATEVLDSPPFGPIVEKLGREAVSERVNVLSGDASRRQAGLGPEQVRDLAGRVSLVINCAGLVEFFPPVDLSLRANVDSVERLLGLCEELGARLLHISTCYVAGEANGLIEETEPIFGILPAARRAGRSSVQRQRRTGGPAGRCRHRGGRPRGNATGRGPDRARARPGGALGLGQYVYIRKEPRRAGARLPIVGPLRHCPPAIVESSLRYPFPGWIEGGRTAAPLALMALGGLLDWPVRRDLSLEIVPVDLVAAATLAVAGELLRGRAGQVYHLAGSDVNPYPLEDLIRLLCAEARANGGRISKAPFWLDPLPRLRFLDAPGAARRRIAQRRRIAAARRILERLRQRERAARLRLLELQIGFHEETFRQYMPFVLENRYVFEAVNIRATYAGLSARDRQALPWDPEAIDWPGYWRTCQIPGIRKWVQPEAVREWTFQL